MKVNPAVFFSFFVFSAVTALPATITGGTTSVALNSGFVSTLTAAGITPSAIAPGALSGTTATFPITSGDTSTGIIDHSGGLSFTKGMNSAVIENFVINLNSMMLSGEVIANGGSPAMGVSLFNIGSGNTLTISSALATDLTAVFGVPSLTGVTVGAATVSPQTASPVPEPSAIALLGFGTLLLAGCIRFAKPVRVARNEV